MKKEIVKRLYYFGENKDLSDKWLIKFLGGYFRIILIKPTSKTPINNAHCIVNRLYVSAYTRYSKKQINDLLSKFKKSKGVNRINSIEGFLLEYDRIKQYNFFNSKNVPFAPTESLADNNGNRLIKFPAILKNNHSGRNKKLIIANNFSDLIKISPSARRNLVAQQLFKNKLCYRTEFIGDTLLTFPQKIRIEKKQLKFRCIPKIITSPLSLKRLRIIKNILNKIGVRVFSIEYFIVKNKLSLVDFNLSSNYKQFLIKRRGKIIKRAWLKLCNL